MKPTDKRLVGYRLALVGLWLAAICIVDPRGNFALDDDWVYAAAVKHLLQTHHFQLPWCSASLFTQALWGAVFCKVFGFSFVTLRASSLVIDIVGLLAFQQILLMLRTDPFQAFLGTLCIMFTPLFFNLSFTFMTDGFFCSCVILSLWLLLRHQETGSFRDLALGMAIAFVSTLTRQIGLCLPVAWAIVKMMERPNCVKAWIAAWMPAVIVGAGLMLYTATLRALHELPATYNLQGASAANALHHPRILLHALTSSIPEILIYLGLYLTPLVPILGYKARRNSALFPKSALIACGIWIAAITPLLLRLHKRIPFRGSTLENFRLGNYFDDNLPILPAYLWYAVTLVGIVGACSVVFAVTVGTMRSADAALPPLEKRRLRFLLLTLVIYFVPVFLVPDYLDRYVLPTIPVALLALFLIANQGAMSSAPIPWINSTASCTILAGFALFSILGTRDYLSYYRTAWIARRFVVSRGVRPDLAFNVPNWGPAYFDGGYLTDDELRMNGPVAHADSGYEVSTSVKPGYLIIKQFSVRLLLNGRDIQFYVSRRP